MNLCKSSLVFGYAGPLNFFFFCALNPFLIRGYEDFRRYRSLISFWIASARPDSFCLCILIRFFFSAAMEVWFFLPYLLQVSLY